MKHVIKLAFPYACILVCALYAISCEEAPKEGTSLPEIKLFEDEWNLDTIPSGGSSTGPVITGSINASADDGNVVPGSVYSYKIDFGSSATTAGTKKAELFFTSSLAGYNMLSFWIKADNASNVGPVFQFIDTQGSLVSSTDSATLPATEQNEIGTEWTRIQIPLYNANAYDSGDTSKPVFVVSNSAATKGAFYLDDIVVSSASLPTPTAITSASNTIDKKFKISEPKTVSDVTAGDVLVQYTYTYDTVDDPSAPSKKTRIYALKYMATWSSFSWSSSDNSVFSVNGNNLRYNDVGSADLIASFRGKQLPILVRIYGKPVANRLYLYGDEKDASDKVGVNITDDGANKWRKASDYNTNLDGREQLGLTTWAAPIDRLHGGTNYTGIQQITSLPYGARGSDNYIEFIGDVPYAITGDGTKKADGTTTRDNLSSNSLENRTPRIRWTKNTGTTVDAAAAYTHLVFYMRKPATLRPNHEHAQSMTIRFNQSDSFKLGTGDRVDVSSAPSNTWKKYKVPLTGDLFGASSSFSSIDGVDFIFYDTGEQKGGGNHNILLDEIYFCKEGSADDGC